MTFGGTNAYQQNIDSATPSLIAAGKTSRFLDISMPAQHGDRRHVYLETFDALAGK
ncbi:MAG: hypothetical protein HT580_06540 [Dechloromonas sp.]|nr:MAG: hypothetical protein HT580_06540 [Dechloromonas sp.]